MSNNQDGSEPLAVEKLITILQTGNFVVCVKKVEKKNLLHHPK